MKDVMNLTPEEKFNQEVWWILQEIKKDWLTTPEDKRVEFNIRTSSNTHINTPAEETQRKLLRKLEKQGIIKIVKELFISPALDSPLLGTVYGLKPKGFILEVLQPKFDKFYKKWGEIDENPWLTKESKVIQRKKLFAKQREEAETYAEEIKRQFAEMDKKQKEKEVLKKEIIEEIKERVEGKTITMPKNFEIQVIDRYIWVNDYILSKPHAVGSNFEFFEYIRSKSANTKIERKNLTSQFGSLSLGEQIKKKSFIKILNEIGFKGEILKAFFPKRGKNMLAYKGDKITKKDLEKAGVKIPLFLKELELAHLKNSPE
jgi:DNA-binding Lrp family transcriptional regulator